jgi:ketosteroid isomerase-like protein
MTESVVPQIPQAPQSPQSSQTEALARLVGFFETISLAEVGRISAFYTDDADFKDPFNQVRGGPAITAIFAHMFEQVDAPRFVVRETVLQGDAAMLIWDFEFAFRKPLPAGQQCIRGCSHVRFAADGRVGWHRDYWDAAEELYEKLPLIGSLMRLLRRRGAVKTER